MYVSTLSCANIAARVSMICMSLIDPLSCSCRSRIKVRMSHRDVEIVDVNPAGHVYSAEIYQQIISPALKFPLTIFDLDERIGQISLAMPGARAEKKSLYSLVIQHYKPRGHTNFWDG